MVFNLGLRLINKNFNFEKIKNNYELINGVIIELKKFHQNGELYIIIEWDKQFNELTSMKIQYAERSLLEYINNGYIEIDKEYYRNEKINQILD